MQELTYTRCGDYYIPDICLDEENRPIGRWGRMHRDYIQEHRPALYSRLCLSDELWIYLADLNEQAHDRLERIIEQMKGIEGITEDLKQHNQMAWIRAMNNIKNRAEEIIKTEGLLLSTRGTSKREFPVFLFWRCHIGQGKR